MVSRSNLNVLGTATGPDPHLSAGVMALQWATMTLTTIDVQHRATVRGATVTARLQRVAGITMTLVTGMVELRRLHELVALQWMIIHPPGGLTQMMDIRPLVQGIVCPHRLTRTIPT